MQETVASPSQAALRTIAPRFVVSDMVRALVFYAQLGFQPVYGDEHFAIIERDGIDLHLNCFPESPSSHAVCWIGVSNIEALYRQYLPTNAISAPLEAKPYGLKQFCVRDPFGKRTDGKRGIAVAGVTHAGNSTRSEF